MQKAERRESLIALATRYREAAGVIRNRAAIQLRRQISEEVGRLWVEITERERESRGWTSTTIGSAGYVRRDGGKVTWEDTNTSAVTPSADAGLLRALRRLAKLAPPLVVDTLLARLDKEVRANVLDQLYLSGHQSIILSTNAEIDPEGLLFERIRARLARVYTLHPHGEPESTTYDVRVTSDYFGHYL